MNDLSAKPHESVLEAMSRYGITCEILACDPQLADTAAFCQHYNFAPEQACNAIIAAGKAEPVQYACALILATCKLDVNKKVCQLLGVKRCSFATSEQTLGLTGMLIGGVTPLGLPEMPIYIDAAVMACSKVVVGGGNRSTKLLLAPQELLKLPHSEVIQQLGIPR